MSQALTTLLQDFLTVAEAGIDAALDDAEFDEELDDEEFDEELDDEEFDEELDDAAPAPPTAFEAPLKIGGTVITV